jgi:hypothetical protein
MSATERSAAFHLAVLFDFAIRERYVAGVWEGNHPKG